MLDLTKAFFKYRIDFSNDPIVGPGPLGATGGEGSNSHTY